MGRISEAPLTNRSKHASQIVHHATGAVAIADQKAAFARRFLVHVVLMLARLSTNSLSARLATLASAPFA